MTMAEKKMKWTSRMREFFGYRTGETLKDFAVELRALSKEERQWFTVEFNRMGMATENPPAQVIPQIPQVR
jgi:hypothetical protein